MGKRLIEDVPGDGRQGSLDLNYGPRGRPLLEIGDVAEELGLHVNGVLHLVATRQLKVWHQTLRGCRLFDPVEVERVMLARASATRAARLARLRRLEVEPRRMARATLGSAKAKGSSLWDPTAKGSGNRRNSHRIA